MKSLILTIVLAATVAACKLPGPDKKAQAPRIQHNYIVLLDLSDRLIVQDNQPERDKALIRDIYSLFEEKVKSGLYIKSGDEIKVVMAPQRGAGLSRDEFEDRLYVNMNNIKKVYRRARESERRKNFYANLDTLYRHAVFSAKPEDYYGADIWKYFHEDLRVDYVDDDHTRNFLFILTDGYPVVGHNQNKLLQVKNEFPDLHIVLLEASPREKDLEWDRVVALWQQWFESMGVKDYTIIKRGSLTKEMEQVRDVVQSRPPAFASGY
ncbi:MAG TPA: hypothetical protein PKW06_06655 [Cyclobacteriaceae bacterium]|nr:hypothetical protein [Cyclobacteriaceae bacterium]MCB9236412.1 hypothetical protein [Flammeovirgaceae bacterium]MCB0499334.1 hypothetical protein [Cyclobacteriaceae bacterium]MCO5272269.1 hypothetical protein [Cyclobacteriaceae bacterium]MCW5902127.1 hypothetical protein [Cyclobacteriaceae bacterium]